MHSPHVSPVRVSIMIAFGVKTFAVLNSASITVNGWSSPMRITW